MKLRSLLLGLAVCLAVVASLGTSSVRAQTQDDNAGNNTLDASIQVTAAGVFDAFFCDIAPLGVTSGVLGNVNLSSTSPLVTTSPGALAICYEDTKPARPSFKTWLMSTNFTSGSDTILATGFKVTRTWNVAQTQWSSGPGGPGIGDIGFNGPSGKNTPTSGSPACPLCYADWTLANSLNGWQYVQFGYSGKGTADGTGFFPGVWASGNSNLGAFGVIEVSLDVPVNTPDGSYGATVTLEINFATP